jgi:transcriptional regulator with AAA-type ATPase domain
MGAGYADRVRHEEWAERMASLRIYQGRRVLIESRLGQGRFLVGRADHCDLALPDDRVSRVHCSLERLREGGVEVVDQSRHGTFVNGQRVERAVLAHGDRVGVGSFELELLSQEGTIEAPPTAQASRDGGHEQLLCSDAQGLGVARLALQIADGTPHGRTLPVPAVDLTVGAAPSDLVIEGCGLLPRHFRLRINRGRVIVQPEAGAVTVDHERVRGLFPLLPGEGFSAGGCELQVVPVTDHEALEAASFGTMIGASPAMRRVFGLLRRMAPHPVPVLLQGESGTGKELAARGLHEAAANRSGAFVAINCAAISSSLFESELFGHEKGSFTGAAGRRDGAFHAADGGTLFLDEIGEIPLHLQAKLLRALESGEVRRVGSNTPSFPDVRVVAATNRELSQEVADGEFREDLYFRLAVLTVHLPPLRERPQDIPVLCGALGRAMSVPLDIHPRAMSLLQAHPWPGNVRELRNVLTRAYVLHGPEIHPQALSFTPAIQDDHPLTLDGEEGVYELSRQNELAVFRNALAKCHGNRAAAARELGLPRTTFLYKLRRLGLEA